MRTYGIPIIGGLLMMLLMDAIWLGLLMKDFYASHLSEIIRPSDAVVPGFWPAAISVYAAMIAAISVFVVFAVPPGGSTRKVVLKGGLLGLLIFTVYEGTNYVFIDTWTLSVFFADIAWGFVLFSTVTFVMHKLRVVPEVKFPEVVALLIICATIAISMQTVASQAKEASHPSAANPESWVDRYGDYLYRYAYSRLGCRELASDCLQDTLLAGIKGVGKFDPTKDEKYWLRGIMRNKIVDHFRQKQRKGSVDLGDDAELLDTALYKYSGIASICPEGWKFDPRKQFDNIEFREVLQSCIDELKEPMREAFVLKMLEGMTATEICEVLDIKSSHLWVLLHRAREQIKGSLEKKWMC